MLWKLFGVFCGGIIVDLLITKYTRCVASHRPKSAAVLSGLITLGNLAIWGTILQDAENLGVYGAIAMALGASVGTLLGFKQHIAAPSSPVVEERIPHVAPVAHLPVPRAPAPAPAPVAHASVVSPTGLARAG